MSLIRLARSRPQSGHTLASRLRVCLGLSLYCQVGFAGRSGYVHPLGASARERSSYPVESYSGLRTLRYSPIWRAEASRSRYPADENAAYSVGRARGAPTSRSSTPRTASSSTGRRSESRRRGAVHSRTAELTESSTASGGRGGTSRMRTVGWLSTVRRIAGLLLASSQKPPRS
jgi:hypothetical protein